MTELQQEVGRLLVKLMREGKIEVTEFHRVRDELAAAIEAAAGDDDDDKATATR